MRLVDQTAVPATLTTSDFEGSNQRIGLLTAKATFRFDEPGHVDLETQELFALLAQDEETPLGCRAPILRWRSSLLGNAYAPRARPVSALTAALTVSKVRREILVFGGRSWAPAHPRAHATRGPLFEGRPFGRPEFSGSGSLQSCCLRIGL